MNALQTLGASTPYSERKLQATLALAPRVAVATMDTYVSTLSSFALPTLATIAPGGPIGAHLTQTAETLGGWLTWMNGLAVAGHGIAAACYFFGGDEYNESAAHKKTRHLKAIGETITAVGYLGQAMGFGPWALPVTMAGVATVMVGTTLQNKTA
jgi:hypothetical protein